jgi:type II secretory pathway pseudopilin PulG
MHQAQVTRDDGYAMVALLVAMALMAVMMSAALPVWRQAAQREKEAELIWRGQQYDRALQLFRRKASAPGAPNLDILIQQKFLRKKYKDPITGGDFELKPVGAMSPGTQRPGMPGAGNMRPGMNNRSSGSGTQTRGFGSQSGVGRPAAAGAQDADAETGTSAFGNQPFGRAGRDQAQPGVGDQRAPGQLIGGVRSKSKARSIRELNGRTHYDQWEFVYVPYNPDPQPPGLGGGNGQQPASGQQRPGGSGKPGAGSSGVQRPNIGGSPIQ